MHLLRTTRRDRRRSSARGFSLIELGIVIAVIAVLAAVILFGRGFILAARVTKAVDASNTVRKAASTVAGLSGGSLGGVAPQNQLQMLSTRSLIPALPQNNPPWTVSGTANSPDAIVMTDVRFGMIGNPAANAVLIRYTFPTVSMAQDLWTAVRDDRNHITAPGSTIGGQACDVTPPSSAAVSVCFAL